MLKYVFGIVCVLFVFDNNNIEPNLVCHFSWIFLQCFIFSCFCFVRLRLVACGIFLSGLETFLFLFVWLVCLCFVKENENDFSITISTQYGTYLDVFENLNMKFETNMKLSHNESESSSSKSNELTTKRRNSRR